MKIYISGGISNLPNDNREAFELAEKYFLNKGYKVVNPLKLDHSNAKCYEDYLKKDIRHMVDCDCIFMLSGYEKSNGARIELDLAIKLGMKIMYEAEE